MSVGNFDTNNITRQTTIFWWVCFGLTAGLGIGSFFCPPVGEISKSVLEFSAWIFGFMSVAVAREAIKEGLGVKFKHGETEMEIKDMDGKGNNGYESVD